jgi:hypothetical protein
MRKTMTVLIKSSEIYRMSKDISKYFRLSLVNEEKLRLEYDLKQRTESLSKQISDLRSENENLQLNYNDK